MEFFRYYFIVAIFSAPPLVISVLQLREALKYKKENNFVHVGISCLIFIAATVYLESQAPFLTGNVVGTILVFILFVVPIFIMFYTVSILYTGWYWPILWSLFISVPMSFIATGYQTRTLGAGLSGMFDYLYVFATYIVFVIISFVQIYLKICEYKDES